MWALFTEAWSPHVVLSLTFWLNSHLERGGSSSLLSIPGLLLLLLLFFLILFYFKLYNIVLVLPNIEMNPPQVYLGF